ncbi:MAG: putative phospholipidtranslocating P-type ATPase, partial [Streblomastix strix]
MFESWFISLYNCVFTLAPIAVYGLGDQELRPGRYARLPATYALGRLGREATPKTFILWICDGLLTSLITFFLAYFMLGDTINPQDGSAHDLWFFGNAVCLAIVITVTLRLHVELNFVTWVHILFSLGSIGAWVIFLAIESTGILNSGMTGTFSILFIQSPQFWFYIILSPIVSLSVSYTIKWINRIFTPNVDAVLRER